MMLRHLFAIVMKFLGVVLLVLFVHNTQALLSVTTLNKQSIPNDIHYDGGLVDGVRYHDNLGDHIVITDQQVNKSKNNGPGEDFRDAQVDAYQYDIVDHKYKLSWQMHDFVKDCSFDIKASFIPGTFAVTDLDHNGMAEVWLMYKTNCTSDVSPGSLKIIMHQAGLKYAMRGTTRVKVNAESYDGGQYTFDEIFNKGSVLFRQYAQQLWKHNLEESWK